MKKLYKLNWKYTDGSNASGVFIEDEEKVKSLFGKTLKFSKGIHSGPIEAEHVTVLCEDLDTVEQMFNNGFKGFGLNPFE